MHNRKPKGEGVKKGKHSFYYVYCLVSSRIIFTKNSLRIKGMSSLNSVTVKIILF